MRSCHRCRRPPLCPRAPAVAARPRRADHGRPAQELQGVHRPVVRVSLLPELPRLRRIRRMQAVPLPGLSPVQYQSLLTERARRRDFVAYRFLAFRRRVRRSSLEVPSGQLGPGEEPVEPRFRQVKKYGVFDKIGKSERISALTLGSAQHFSLTLHISPPKTLLWGNGME